MGDVRKLDEAGVGEDRRGPSVVIKIDCAVVLGTLAHACCLAAIAVAFLSPQMMGQGDTGVFDQGCRAASVAACVVSFLCALLLAKKVLARLSRIVTILFSVVGCLPLAAMIWTGDHPLSLWLAVWALSGVALAVLVYRSSLFYSMAGSSKTVIIVVAVSLAFAAGIFGLSAFALNAVGVSVVLAVLPIASTVLFEMGKSIVPREEGFDDMESERLFFEGRLRQGLVDGLWGMAAGFVLGLFVGTGEASAFPAGALAALIAAAVLCAVIAFAHNARHLFLGDVEGMLLPVCVASLLLLAGLPQDMLGVASLLMLASFVLYVEIRLLDIADFVRELKTHAVSLVSLAMIAQGAGVACGWLGAMAVLYWHVESPFIPVIASAIILAAVVLLVAEGQCARADAQAAPVGGLLSEDASEGKWRRRVTEISQEAKLSPRQHEVFVFLAKGRNAQYIANELFIAVHTAKAHIYRIYQKVGVHTQQELLDFIENHPS